MTASDPDLGNWTYVYDNAGRLTDQTDAKGQVTHLTYDALGRVLTKTAKYGTGSPEVTTYTYDEARATYYNVGHLTTAANAAATIKYDFDKDGHQLRQQYVVDGDTYTISHTLDIGGRLLTRSYPNGFALGSLADPLIYDSAGRLKTVPGILSGTTYNARGQALTVNRVNSVNSTNTYSAERGWLTGISTSGAASNLDFTYGRDFVGRISGITSSVTGEEWIYSYDGLDRLTSADNVDDNTMDQTFTYDTVGNMLTNSKVGNYTYPAPGSPRPHAVTSISGGPAGTMTFGYDANGNMTDRDGDDLTYDGANRLIEHGTFSAFTYGPDGARLIQEHIIDEVIYLGADTEINNGTHINYLPGDARRNGSTTRWMLRDHLGSVRELTSSAGAVNQAAKYRPFGERIITNSGTSESHGYIGERHDDHTGLMYLNARYYDPAIGRFMSADPLSPATPGVGVNRYSYAFNNPIMLLDPSGLGGNWADNPRNNHSSAGAAHTSVGGTTSDGGYHVTNPEIFEQLLEDGMPLSHAMIEAIREDAFTEAPRAINLGFSPLGSEPLSGITLANLTEEITNPFPSIEALINQILGSRYDVAAFDVVFIDISPFQIGSFGLYSLDTLTAPDKVSTSLASLVEANPDWTSISIHTISEIASLSGGLLDVNINPATGLGSLVVTPFSDELGITQADYNAGINFGMAGSAWGALTSDGRLQVGDSFMDVDLYH